MKKRPGRLDLSVRLRRTSRVGSHSKRTSLACYIFGSRATFFERISLQNKSRESVRERNSDKCFVCCMQTRPRKIVQGPAINVSNPTLSAILDALQNPGRELSAQTAIPLGEECKLNSNREASEFLSLCGDRLRIGSPLQRNAEAGAPHG